MRHDDDEFIDAAKIVLEHIQWKEVLDMDRKLKKMESDLSAGAQDGNGIERREAEERDDDDEASLLSQDFLTTFVDALQYRLDNLPRYPASTTDDEMHKFTLEVQNVIERAGLPNVRHAIGNEEVSQDQSENYVQVPGPRETLDRSEFAKKGAHTCTVNRRFFPVSPLKSDCESAAVYMPREDNVQNFGGDGIPKKKSSNIAQVDDVDWTFRPSPLPSREESNVSRRDSKMQGGFQETSSYAAYQGVRDKSSRVPMHQGHAYVNKPYHRRENEVKGRVQETNASKLYAELERKASGLSATISKSFDDGATALKDACEPLKRGLDNSLENFLLTPTVSDPPVKAEGVYVANIIQDNHHSGDTTDDWRLRNAELARKRSEKRQIIVGEIEKLKKMLSVTTNTDVTRSCHQRIVELRRDLEKMTFENAVPLSNGDTPSSASEVTSEKEEKIHRTVATDTPAKQSYLPQSELEVQRKVQVVAPADLPENYRFPARIGTEEFVATVPSGGVLEGQIFTSKPDCAVEHAEDQIHKSALECTAAQTAAARDIASTNLQPRHWKDSACDCMNYGINHPSFITGFFCPMLALAQVQTRLKLTWQAIPGPAYKVKDTFACAIVFTVFVLLQNVILLTVPQVTYSSLSQKLPYAVAAVVDVICFLCFLVIVTRTRRYFRWRFSIKEKRCHGCEDSCMSFFCSSCVVMQMLRTSADYDTYHARCCTNNGLPKHVVVSPPPIPEIRNDQNCGVSFNEHVAHLV